MGNDASVLFLDPAEMRRLLESYFNRFGDKAVCFEDLRPYISLEGDVFTAWSSFLKAVPSTPVSWIELLDRLPHQSSCAQETRDDLSRYMNAQKLLRYNLSTSEVTSEAEAACALQYFSSYLDALKFGKELPDTELQPADDLALLSGQAFVGAWKAGGEAVHLYQAAAVLEYASSRSKQSYLIRLLLIRVYRLLGTFMFGSIDMFNRVDRRLVGASSLALEHYRAMNVKQVQTDTLSHLILTRASTFSLSSIGDLTYSSECLESSQIYLTNSQEVCNLSLN